MTFLLCFFDILYSHPLASHPVFPYKGFGISGQAVRRSPADSSAGGKSGLHLSRALDNVQSGRPEGQCHREETANPRVGKGETVR